MSHLPQATHTRYRYLPYTSIHSTYFPDHLPLPSDTICRVLLSKGADNKRTKLTDSLVRTVPVTTPPSTDNEKDETNESSPKEERVLIRYPRGSTYHIRRTNLLPVLTPHYSPSPPSSPHNLNPLPRAILPPLVILVPETPEYRRLCSVHTLPTDHFIEIGSDFGLTISRVNASSPKAKLGIDKSSTSVGIARRDFPEIPFQCVDVLVEGEQTWRELYRGVVLADDDGGGVEGEEKGRDLVVGVDVNGNRELEAVRDVVKRVLEWWCPRLVVVKSRTMVRAFEEGEEGKGGEEKEGMENTDGCVDTE